MANNEIIQFNNQVGGVKVRQKGIRISDDLAVAYSSPYSSEDRYRVFSIISGRPVVPLEFSSMDDAKEFAVWMDKTYKEFWPLLQEYPRIDIPQVCMWSIPDGIRIKVALDKLISSPDVSLTPSSNKDTITMNDLRRAYQAATDDDYMKPTSRT